MTPEQMAEFRDDARHGVRLCPSFLTDLLDEIEALQRLLRQCKMLAMKDDGEDSTVAEMHAVPLEQIPDFVNSRITDLECEAAHEPTWGELMEVIDKRYPPEVFGKGSDDNTGPRIVALCREIDRQAKEIAEVKRTVNARMSDLRSVAEHSSQLMANEAVSCKAELQWVLTLFAAEAKENDQ